MMKKILLIAILLPIYFGITAQQDAMYTLYNYNTLAVNPAYAGSRDALTITALNRAQWLGYEGSPITQTLTMHSPIFNNKVGGGISIVQDITGPTKLHTIYSDLSYKLKVSEKGTLTFGLKGGLNILNNNLANIEVIDNDPLFNTNINNQLLPNFGFGLYYFKEKFYLGISSPRIIQNSFNSNSSILAEEKRHYYLVGGFVSQLNENIEFKPTTLLKVTQGAPFSLDLTNTFIFREKVWAGLMVRVGDAVGIITGIILKNHINVGYSFDWSYGLQTGRYNQGSHELMLRYDFIFSNQEKYKSPRYF